jgi:hypothetical protein
MWGYDLTIGVGLVEAVYGLAPSEPALWLRPIYCRFSEERQCFKQSLVYPSGWNYCGLSGYVDLKGLTG